MRKFKDEQGRTAWIFDEYNHPKGLYYKKTPEEIEAINNKSLVVPAVPKVEVEKVVVKKPVAVAPVKKKIKK